MNTPTAFYEQRQRLDMAKKHDILKQKMQRRPDREELVRQHILEGEDSCIDYLEVFWCSFEIIWNFYTFTFSCCV